MENNREKELKLLIDDKSMSLKDAKAVLETAFKGQIERSLSGQSSDYYWHPPKPSADFARVRSFQSGEKSGQLTVKATDQGCNYNRIEIDVEVSNIEQAKKFCDQLLGEMAGVIAKKYEVFFLKAKSDLNVCLYKIIGDDRLFIEIEGARKDELQKAATALMNNTDLKLLRVSGSLYQIFIKKNKFKQNPVSYSMLKAL